MVIRAACNGNDSRNHRAATGRVLGLAVGIALLSGCGSSGTGATSSTGGTSATTTLLCAPGSTQTCFGPGQCAGAQVCSTNGMLWEACDCGTGAGGAGPNGDGGATSNGGASGGAAQSSAGTANDSAGAVSTGGTSATTGGSAGTINLNSICPPYDGTGGTLITPPSTGFEGSVTDWSTLALNSQLLALAQGPANACEGSSYLTCGARTATWDGPAIDVTSYVIVDHQYSVSLAVRFDPTAALASERPIRLIYVKNCEDSSISSAYAVIGQVSTAGNWARITGAMDVSLIANCSSLKSTLIYVETEATEVQTPIHIDDFRMYDVTPPSGTGGASGSGGTTSSGGETSSGGATS